MLDIIISYSNQFSIHQVVQQAVTLVCKIPVCAIFLCNEHERFTVSRPPSKDVDLVQRLRAKIFAFFCWTVSRFHLSQKFVVMLLPGTPSMCLYFLKREDLRRKTVANYIYIWHDCFVIVCYWWKKICTMSAPINSPLAISGYFQKEKSNWLQGLIKTMVSGK